MGAKARKSEVKEVAQLPPRNSLRLAVSSETSLRDWMKPHLNTFAHESAKSIGRQVGPTLKWVVVGMATSGSAVAIAGVISGVLAR